MGDQAYERFMEHYTPAAFTRQSDALVRRVGERYRRGHRPKK